MSAQDGELDVTRLLLNAGANVNVIKHHGGTPLHLAAEEGHAEIAKALADAGANVEMLDDVSCPSCAQPLWRLTGACVHACRTVGLLSTGLAVQKPQMLQWVQC